MTIKPENSEVEEALVNILSDDKFAAAPQMSAFLKYVVNQTLYEDPSRIKAYTVAVDALGKAVTFDPQNDPSVRVLAKRLRTSLDGYYERHPDTAVLIEMKAGSYVPRFAYRSAETPPTGAMPASGAPAAGAPAAGMPATGIPTTGAPAAGTPAASHTSTDRMAAEHSPQGIESERNAGVTAQVNGQQDNPTQNPATPWPDPAAPLRAETPGAVSPATAAVTTQTTPTALAGSVPGAVAAASSAAAARPKPELESATLTIPTQDKHPTPGMPAQDSGTSASSVFGKLGAFPRPALAIGFVAGLLWLVTGNNQESDNPQPLALAAALPALSPVHQRLAGIDNGQGALRGRPDNITILGISTDHDSTINSYLTDTISSVITRFDHVDFYKTTDHKWDTASWPEDYHIKLSTIAIDEYIQMNVQLISASTSRIAFTDSLNLNPDSSAQLSASDFEKVQNLAARWLQPDGQLMQDYKNSSHMTSHMACYYTFSNDPLLVSSAIKQSCDDYMLTDAHANDNWLRTKAEHLLNAIESGQQTDEQSIVDMVELAREASSRWPYSPDARITLATALRLQGNLDESAVEASIATSLNPYSSRVLRESALIEDTLGNIDSAVKLRELALRYQQFPGLAQHNS